jgi:hypothetical protein
MKLKVRCECGAVHHVSRISIEGALGGGTCFSNRYRFRHVPTGALYGITPELWDRPTMTEGEARELLCIAYGVDSAELEALP